MKKKLILCILLVFGAIAIGDEPADNVYWNGGTGLWMDGANWTDDPALPDWSIPGYVGVEGYDWNKGVAVITSGTAQITSGSAPDGRVEKLVIGGTGGASVDISGNVEFNRVLTANEGDQTGTINQTGGNVTIRNGGGLSTFGVNGSSSYNLSGGSLTLSNNGIFGGSAGATSQFNQTGGSFLANDTAQHFYVGNAAGSSGQFDIEGGNFTISSKELYLGTSGSGTMNVSGNANVSLSTNANQFYIAKNAGSSGSLNVQGGTVNINSTGPNGAIIGYSGNGTVNQTGGTLNITAPRLYIGWNTSSSMNFNNGTINVSGGTQYPSYAVIGRGTANNTSTLNMSGGTLNVTTADAIGMTLGYYGNGTTYQELNKGIVNLSGGTMNINAALNIGWSGIGQFNLSGSGTLNASRVEMSYNHNSLSSALQAIQGSSLTISGGAFDADTYLRSSSQLDVITILGSEASKIEMSRMEMVAGSKLAIKLDEDGSTLIQVTGSDTNPYNGAMLAGISLEVDTLLGFDGQTGDRYNVLWSATTIDDTGLSFVNLSSTPFIYQIVNAADYGYTSGQLMQLVVPEPVTITLLSIGLLLVRRR
ncbi:MAG: hypothetical protein A2Y10_18620 [Planctomycetes bacterium GWF2_41_51]|nr:MAG: hypothetical protein A2Y10_18620 [Planctomycetes bacterium GWF2_41_51]HBG27138.1 hypothetical protein [Phycisphaerales bacterium]